MITEPKKKAFGLRRYEKSQAENESRSYCEIANASPGRMKHSNSVFSRLLQDA